MQVARAQRQLKAFGNTVSLEIGIVCHLEITFYQMSCWTIIGPIINMEEATLWNSAVKELNLYTKETDGVRQTRV